MDNSTRGILIIYIFQELEKFVKQYREEVDIKAPWAHQREPDCKTVACVALWLFYLLKTDDELPKDKQVKVLIGFHSGIGLLCKILEVDTQLSELPNELWPTSLITKPTASELPLRAFYYAEAYWSEDNEKRLLDTIPISRVCKVWQEYGARLAEAESELSYIIRGGVNG